MSSQPILARWDEIRAAHKNDPAIFAPDGRALRTFGGIQTEAEEWEGRLAEYAGRTVVMQPGNVPAWPALLLACWRAGCAVVPLEAEVPEERQRGIEERCGVGARLVSRDGGIQLEARDNPPRVIAEDLLKVTSGTSAEPRAVRFTAAQLLADCDNICDSMDLRESDRNYGVISLAHSYGFSNLITPLLCRGVPLVAAADAIPQALIAGFRASGATIFPGVPALFRVLGPLDPGETRLRRCISAGAPLDAAAAGRFAERWGLKVHSFYGASECGGICYDASEDRAVPPGYVGAPLRNVRLEHPGGIAPGRVHSAAVGLGYFPDRGDDALAEKVFAPADLLEARDGGYVITGRLSDFINVAGRKVNPGDIEQAVAAHPAVREAVALGVAAPGRGEEIVVIVAGNAEEQELRAFCAARLPSWQMPRRWVFWDEIPRNTRGKISRADLRARL